MSFSIIKKLFPGKANIRRLTVIEKNMKFELNNFHRNIKDEELLDDLKRVNSILSKNGQNLTYSSYDEYGNFTAGTISIRFTSWNKALIKAGISITKENNISNAKLFENLKKVWIHKGAQPVTRDMQSSFSIYSASTYSNKFGSWRKALEEFIDYINSEFPDDKQEGSMNTDIEKK